jgi:hypothetical protein
MLFSGAIAAHAVRRRWRIAVLAEIECDARLWLWRSSDLDAHARRLLDLFLCFCNARFNQVL